MNETNELVILAGGVELPVELRDGSTQTVKVQQLSIRNLEKWVNLMGREPEQVELCCSQDEGWADSVVTTDYEKLVDLMERLNRPTLDRWMVRVQGSIGLASDLFQRGLAARKQAEALVPSAPSSASAPS